MGWFLVFLASLFEIGWAIGLKHAANGFQPLIWAGTLLCMIASLALLGLSLKTLPLGSAYAAWTGFGTLGAVILGILLFGEAASFMRFVCVGLILAGIAGLKMS